jgi:hypothetical protein
LIFFFAFPGSRGKFGKQSLRFRAAKTFFFGITAFLYQNKNPEAHLSLGIAFLNKGSIKALSSSIKALLRLYQGPMKALSRLYQGSIKALSRLY